MQLSCLSDQLGQSDIRPAAADIHWLRQNVIVENMPTGSSESTTNRLLEAAAGLLREGGVQAVSTRAVAAAAGTQPPVLYRRFGDKQGLLEAVALHMLHGHLAEMRSCVEQLDDPVDGLRSLWDLYVEFAYAHPECITLIYLNVRRGEAISSAANAMKSIIEEAIVRI